MQAKTLSVKARWTDRWTNRQRNPCVLAVYGGTKKTKTCQFALNNLGHTIQVMCTIRVHSETDNVLQLPTNFAANHTC